MKQKDLPETFIMFANWNNSFGLLDLKKKYLSIVGIKWIKIAYKFVITMWRPVDWLYQSAIVYSFVYNDI